jgi:hypothetical protein
MKPGIPFGKMIRATVLLLAMTWSAFSQPSAAPSMTGDAISGSLKPVVIVPDAGKYAWLGFEVSRADDAVRAQLPKLPKGMGFVISKVEANGPARRAGVEAMDVLWRLNDQFLINEAQLASLLQLYKAGDVVELTLFRGGEEKKTPRHSWHSPRKSDRRRWSDDRQHCTSDCCSAARASAPGQCQQPHRPP